MHNGFCSVNVLGKLSLCYAGIGMALWGVGAVACGLARGFWSLLLARMLVGSGELLSTTKSTTVAPIEYWKLVVHFQKSWLQAGASVARLVTSALITGFHTLHSHCRVAGQPDAHFNLAATGPNNLWYRLAWPLPNAALQVFIGHDTKCYPMT